jgi:vancomycin permeability regulator SanA
MIRGLFRLIFRLVFLAILILVGTAVWIVYDGLNDNGDHADVAVVPGGFVRRDGVPGPLLRSRLDRCIELYRAGKFPLIIVSGATKIGGYDEAAAMSNYLIEHQVPVTAIIQDKEGAHTSDTGADVERIMRARHLDSAMIVTNYYHITRMKLALKHAGVPVVEQQHVGVVQKEDAAMLARETLALYDYLFKYYGLPAFEKAKVEARADGEKLKTEAQKDGEKAKEEADRAKDKLHDDIAPANK